MFYSAKNKYNKIYNIMTTSSTKHVSAKTARLKILYCLIYYEPLVVFANKWFVMYLNYNIL
jgi:hypothetical protein